jgi:hypothetical protein
VDIVVLLRDSLDGYRRLLREYEERGTSADLRAAALQLARKIAAYQRLTMISALGELLENLPEEVSPHRGLAVLQDLSYALIQLGQEEPDPRTLLSEQELDQLMETTGAGTWMEGALEAIPDDWET